MQPDAGNMVPIRKVTTAGQLLCSLPGLREVWNAVQLVAPTAAAVLLQGETGVGKEVVGRAIHAVGSRQHCPFVKLNCAALPATLIETELFGPERGAFTGAVARTEGRFQQAHTGTLLLDEIGDLPLELQPKLLRVLQDHEFERLGGCQTVRVDVRVVAATNADLPEMIHERRFRLDLFYRLNVFPIRIPPLRERRGDIPLLADYFLRTIGSRMGKNVSYIPEQVLKTLVQHDWPGNVRELQNVMERAVIMSVGPELELPPSTLQLRDVRPNAAQTLAEVERAHILDVLAKTEWVIGGRRGAAAWLGLPRTTLISRIQKLGITRQKPVARERAERSYPVPISNWPAGSHPPESMRRVQGAGAL